MCGEKMCVYGLNDIGKIFSQIELKSFINCCERFPAASTMVGKNYFFNVPSACSLVTFGL